MPIPFSLLPEHLRIEIVQKQEIRDFLEFHVSSRHSYKIAVKTKTRFVVHMETAQRWENDKCEGCFPMEKGRKFCILDEEVINIPLQIVFGLVIIEGRISNNFCEKLTKFLQITNYSFEEIQFYNFNNIECTSDQFNSFLEASKAVKLGMYCENEYPLEILRVPAMKQIREFTAASFSALFNDAQFLAVKASSIKQGDSTNITSTGLNSFLKQWLRGEREIGRVSMGFNQDIEIEKAFLEIPYRTEPNCDSTFMVSVVEREKDQKKIVVQFRYDEYYNTRHTLLTIYARPYDPQC